MNANRRANHLTKSRFKIGYECPTKLAYVDDKEFGNNNAENSFLEALAEGGFQVGELAKIYHPGGIEITTKNKVDAVKQTSDLLAKEKVTIYEAAFLFENLFVRADIVVKNGDMIELTEVKAKSYDPRESDPFYTKASLKKGTPKLSSAWEPYLVDVAYQAYVLKKAMPRLRVTSSLMLADKTAVASVNGLNQRFLLLKTDGANTTVKVASETNEKSVGNRLLVKVPVDSEVKIVWDMTFVGGRSFERLVNDLSQACENSNIIPPEIGSKCKNCEFRIGQQLKDQGLKSGFESCWSTAANLKPTDFKRPFVFEIWNFRKSPTLIDAGKYFVDQIDIEDVSPSSKASDVGLSSSQRQWLQIEKIQQKDQTPFLDIQGLSDEMKSWTYPLHFIDFETTMAAIPFNRGRRPYEQTAFQFSHHLVDMSGKFIHQDEFINMEKGKFPNFEFVRSLKAALFRDEGTIFRFATHENTVLCQIRQQIMAAKDEVPDHEELISFIESITSSTGDSVDQWDGKRNMIDMCELVKKFFYHPLTNGSNSIKKVLPAILSESTYLQKKFESPIYGTNDFPSKNYKNWVWIKKDKTGDVLDPYKLLPEIFSDLDAETMDRLVTDDTIADGGGAMTAYARMQFSEMTDVESERVVKALLQYCELDTFAMVLIYDYWTHEIEVAKSKAA